MKMYILSLALVVAALALGASPARAVVIDFETLVLGNQGGSVSEDGFTLTSTNSPNGLQAQDFGGSTTLFENYRFGAVTELALTGGGSFSLSSIDLAELSSELTRFDVTFTGDISGGGPVINTFAMDGLLGAQTFTFTGFGSVNKVSWGQGTEFTTVHQFDNIVASVNNGHAVPEPASLGFLGLGLAGLAWIRRGARQ